MLIQVGVPEQRPAGRRSGQNCPGKEREASNVRVLPGMIQPGLALSDVPEAMRAGAAIPKADDLRPRIHPQDHGRGSNRVLA